MTHRKVGALLATLLATAACSASGDNSDFDGSSKGAGAGSGEGGSGSGNTGSGDGGSLSLDAGTDGSSDEASCQYVDILFLIDNSPSMSDPQEKLAGTWPTFVEAMFQKLPKNIDLHVGITTTSFFTGSCSESTINCATAQTPAEVSAHFIDPATQNTDENGAQGRLYEYQGKKFFAANTSDADHGPLTTWFQGAATEAGESGCSYEFSSAGAAFTTAAANAAHNAGFFRDEDGVLLIIFLTDEPDKSQEAPAVYHDMIASVKQGCGGDDCILTAGLIDPCVQESNQTVWQVMSSFGEPPIWGDIEGEPAEYAQVVGDALAQVVKKTCDEIAVPK
jgi:hypothetical protein